ncbi:glycerol dehydrogenase [Uliginosibacterium gangwonense]|uniref:glycerol dehydrogenase n=1 Tax=Uliginosibacterium gangwonense TaxID=392736 RepID=UPI0003A8C178|nr:glycerol dehydrogenase [Uliginosibacterium gangwonense]
MHTTCQFPGRYIQGPTALQALNTELVRLGGRAMLLQDDFAAKSLGPRLAAQLTEAGLLAGEAVLSGPNSEANASVNAQAIQRCGAQVLLGVGGGKVLDAAKAAAELAGVALILIPSAASTDAPCSSVAVMQTGEGAFSHYRFLRHNPACVLVDTSVIASAPLRMLVAGIGDALSTWFEAEESRQQGWLNIAGTPPSALALAIARQCYDTVMDCALEAVAQLRNRQPGEAFERIVEANILLSGLGFESGGLGTAHAIQNGLTALPACRGILHGELVTLGLLAMLNLAQADTYPQVRRFAQQLGLPVSLADVGLADASDEMLLQAATLACNSAPMNRVAAGVKPVDIVAALRACG